MRTPAHKKGSHGIRIRKCCVIPIGSHLPAGIRYLQHLSIKHLRIGLPITRTGKGYTAVPKKAYPYNCLVSCILHSHNAQHTAQFSFSFLSFVSIPQKQAGVNYLLFPFFPGNAQIKINAKNSTATAIHRILASIAWPANIS